MGSFTQPSPSSSSPLPPTPPNGYGGGGESATNKIGGDFDSGIGLESKSGGTQGGGGQGSHVGFGSDGTTSYGGSINVGRRSGGHFISVRY
ncbi:hypothetical protein VNO78_21751 [Psophocarpus tetragonolobus]|uniref:Uncharacterized protein n=1 Tax=Psophocarpus tetragonolobus TaxID=3891 RepID=A0AAN9XIF1_PSOTE